MRFTPFTFVSLCALILSFRSRHSRRPIVSLLAVVVVGIHTWTTNDYNDDDSRQKYRKNIVRATACIRDMIDADQPHDLSHRSLIVNWTNYLVQLSKFQHVNAGYILTLKDGRLIDQFDENGDVAVRASLCRLGTEPSTRRPSHVRII